MAPWQAVGELMIDKRFSFSLINNVIFIYTPGKYLPRGQETLTAKIDDILFIFNTKQSLYRDSKTVRIFAVI